MAKSLTIYVGTVLCKGVAVSGGGGGTILFASGFSSTTALSGMVSGGSTSCWTDYSGTDGVTGYAWPMSVWGGGGRGQHIADTSINTTTILNYIDHTIVNQAGHLGPNTNMSYQILKQPSPGSALQTVGILMQPSTGHAQGDMYISMWLKFNTGFAADMGNNAWRSFFAWKTQSSIGDYRVEQYIYTNSSGTPYWYMQGDNNANNPSNPPYQQFWDNSNTAVAVPDGTWFQYEIAWHRSASDGWIWAKVNGTLLYSRNTSLIGVNNAKIDRIMLSLVYGDVTKPAYYPMEQWWDDLEIRDAMP